MHLFETQSASTATSAALDAAVVDAADTFQPPTDSAATEQTDAQTTDANTRGQERRICALHERSPIQMFMFDKRGALLTANTAARRGLQTHAGQLLLQASIPKFWSVWVGVASLLLGTHAVDYACSCLDHHAL